MKTRNVPPDFSFKMLDLNECSPPSSAKSEALGKSVFTGFKLLTEAANLLYLERLRDQLVTFSLDLPFNMRQF